MGFFSKITKPFKKLARESRQGFSTFTQLAAPFTGKWAPIVLKAGQLTAPGDTAKSNERKRADFEYARSLADQTNYSSLGRRVAEAKAAGLHPLAALGYQAPSFTPPQSNYYSGGSDGLYEMGQDIARAAMAGETQAERTASVNALQSAIDTEQLRGIQLSNEGQGLQNEYYRLRLLRMFREKGPNFPTTNNSVGQVVRSHLPDRMAIQQIGMAELNPTDEWREVTDRSGFTYYAPPPSQDNELAQAEAFFRNKILYHAYQPFARAGKMFEALPDYLGRGYKPKEYPSYPARIPRRVRGSRVNPAYYRDGWYN